MKNYLQIILTILILNSCGQKQNEKKDLSIDRKVESSNSMMPEYSEEFLKHFNESNSAIKGDSIVFPKEAGSLVVLIPNYIPKNKDVKFKTADGNSITIRQVNYTDIEFLIQHDNEKFKGKASLYPHFYLGMETVGFTDGEYIVTNYYVTESDNPCLDLIGLGNQNIAEENPENVYALISVSGDNCEDELNKLTNKKLKTVANNV